MGQWSGLITSCVTFPELKNTSGLIVQALAELQALLADGVYPDGVETELASGYDIWTASEFLGVLQTLAYGRDTLPPQAFADHVEAMWNYGAYVTDPAGCLPRNGDSDLCGGGFSAAATAYFRDVRHFVDIALLMLFWTTPIVYPLSQVPDWLRLPILLSPMSPFIVAYHAIFFDGVAPDASVWAVAIAYSLTMLALGTVWFVSVEDELSEHL